MIQHKESYEFLPQPDKGLGFTKVAPTLFGIPKLYKSKVAALKDLTLWCKGIRSYDGGYLGTGVRVREVPGRNEKDFEIIQVYIKPL